MNWQEKVRAAEFDARSSLMQCVLFCEGSPQHRNQIEGHAQTAIDHIRKIISAGREGVSEHENKV